MIHGPLSLVRGSFAGLNHLERRLGWLSFETRPQVGERQWKGRGRDPVAAFFCIHGVGAWKSRTT